MREKIILVHIEFPRAVGVPSGDLEEFKDLALSVEVDIVATIIGKRELPDAKYFVGKGKAEEIKEAVSRYKPTLIIFDHTLSPGQERNLEAFLKCRILGRTGLILDIFARRARSFEGKLQVELAQLKYLSTRLVRGWEHLERQRGGIGLKGPGETQLETDRRLLRKRVAALKIQLEKVRNQRHQGRRLRRKKSIPLVVLVGYTNAGKSTLFNQLAKANSYVADKLFATLDTTLRKTSFPKIGEIIIADTVGFIHNLPHELVDAFRATLEETQNADLLLHIVDANDPLRENKIVAVNEVLKTIDADKVPQLIVYNKSDLLSTCDFHIERNHEPKPIRVWVSALNGFGINLVREALSELLPTGFEEIEVCIFHSAAKFYVLLHKKRVVVEEAIDTQGNFHLKLQMRRSEFDNLIAQKNFSD